jgi:DNA-binding response OmpR family regulator
MRQGPTVIIASDHPAEQALVRYWLANRGVKAVELPANAGVPAMAAHAPDLILLDDSAVGDLQQLKEALPKATVAVISRGPLAGVEADAVLRRPIDLELLGRTIAPLLDAASAKPRRKRVLLCDDDADFVRFAESVLTKAGCEVISALDAQRFLARLPDLTNVDVALLDLRMPGINGLQVCAFLRERGADLRICMITASNDPENVKLAEQAGADGWLTKPVRSRELLAIAGIEVADEVAPVEPKRAAKVIVAEPPKPAARPARKQRVLVIDDDAEILEFCSRVLRRAGAVVDVREPADLQSDPPDAGSYDVVLVDLRLGAKSGLEVMKDLVADVRNVAARLYIVSASDDEALRAEATRCGADGWIKKPLATHDLVDLLG